MTAWVSSSQLSDFFRNQTFVPSEVSEQARACVLDSLLVHSTYSSRVLASFATPFWLSQELADHHYLPGTPQA